jgi:hypothetical protein
MTSFLQFSPAVVGLEFGLWIGVHNAFSVDRRVIMFLFCSYRVNGGKRAMSHRQTRMERADEGSFSHWVALPEEKCIGANYQVHREFCQKDGLSLSRFGHAVVWQKEWYQVFRFGCVEDADRFMAEFGGERMHPSEKGKGKNWARWRKGSHKS